MRRTLAKALPLLMLVCLGFSSCGGDKNGSPTNPDEQLIRQMIVEWIALLEAGDEGALETLFDPATWMQSPTRTRLSELTGKSLAASSILVGAQGEDATASFNLNVAGDGSISVTWILQKTEDKWLISFEEWTD